MEEKKIVVDAATGLGEEIIKKDGKMIDKKEAKGIAHIDKNKYIAAKQLRNDKSVDEVAKNDEKVVEKMPEEDEPIV